MKIEIVPQRADYSSAELLDLSRTLRRIRNEVEDVRRQLRHHTQLDGCRQLLQKQEDTLMLSTARMMDLSNALNEIADLYRTVEDKNADHLEERASERYIRSEVTIFSASSSINLQIRTILNQ